MHAYVQFINTSICIIIIITYLYYRYRGGYKGGLWGLKTPSQNTSEKSMYRYKMGL